MASRTLVVLGAALALAPAAPAGAQLRIGISEQNATMFASPWFERLGVRQARIVVPWNILERTDYWPGYLRAWLDGAARTGVEPHVAFGIADIVPREFGRGPTPRQYAALVRGFRRAYPEVRVFTPWNEANHRFQPTARRPRLAWRYHRILERACPGCTVLAADVADGRNLGGWLRAFRRLHGPRGIWGLHNYQDANQRRPLRASWTLRMTRMVRGPIWSSEAGGLVGFKSLGGGARLRYDPARQLRAQRHLFALLRHPSVRRRYPRVYVYSWFGTWTAARSPTRWSTSRRSTDAIGTPAPWRATCGASSREFVRVSTATWPGSPTAWIASCTTSTTRAAPSCGGWTCTRSASPAPAGRAATIAFATRSSLYESRVRAASTTAGGQR